MYYAPTNRFDSVSSRGQSAGSWNVARSTNAAWVAGPMGSVNAVGVAAASGYHQHPHQLQHQHQPSLPHSHSHTHSQQPNVNGNANSYRHTPTPTQMQMQMDQDRISALREQHQRARLRDARVNGTGVVQPIEMEEQLFGQGYDYAYGHGAYSDPVQPKPLAPVAHSINSGSGAEQYAGHQSSVNANANGYQSNGTAGDSWRYSQSMPPRPAPAPATANGTGSAPNRGSSSATTATASAAAAATNGYVTNGSRRTSTNTGNATNGSTPAVSASGASAQSTATSVSTTSRTAAQPPMTTSRNPSQSSSFSSSSSSQPPYYANTQQRIKINAPRPSAQPDVTITRANSNSNSNTSTNTNASANTNTNSTNYGVSTSSTGRQLRPTPNPNSNSNLVSTVESEDAIRCTQTAPHVNADADADSDMDEDTDADADQGETTPNISAIIKEMILSPLPTPIKDDFRQADSGNFKFPQTQQQRQHDVSNASSRQPASQTVAVAAAASVTTSGPLTLTSRSNEAELKNNVKTPSLSVHAPAPAPASASASTLLSATASSFSSCNRNAPGAAADTDAEFDITDDLQLSEEESESEQEAASEDADSPSSDDDDDDDEAESFNQQVNRVKSVSAAAKPDTCASTAQPLHNGLHDLKTTTNGFVPAPVQLPIASASSANQSSRVSEAEASKAKRTETQSQSQSQSRTTTLLSSDDWVYESSFDKKPDHNNQNQKPNPVAVAVAAAAAVSDPYRTAKNFDGALTEHTNGCRSAVDSAMTSDNIDQSMSTFDDWSFEALKARCGRGSNDKPAPMHIDNDPPAATAPDAKFANVVKDGTKAKQHTKQLEVAKQTVVSEAPTKPSLSRSTSYKSEKLTESNRQSSATKPEQLKRLASEDLPPKSAKAMDIVDNLVRTEKKTAEVLKSRSSSLAESSLSTKVSNLVPNQASAIDVKTKQNAKQLSVETSSVESNSSSNSRSAEKKRKQVDSALDDASTASAPKKRSRTDAIADADHASSCERRASVHDKQVTTLSTSTPTSIKTMPAPASTVLKVDSPATTTLVTTMPLERKLRRPLLVSFSLSLLGREQRERLACGGQPRKTSSTLRQHVLRTDHVERLDTSRNSKQQLSNDQSSSLTPSSRTSPMPLSAPLQAGCVVSERAAAAYERALANNSFAAVQNGDVRNLMAMPDELMRRLAPPEALHSAGRELKHAADAMRDNQLQRVVTYLRSVLEYVSSLCSMEFHDANLAQHRFSMCFDMTVLVKHVRTLIDELKNKRVVSRGAPSSESLARKILRVLTVVCARLQAGLHFKMYSLKKEDVARTRCAIDEYKSISSLPASNEMFRHAHAASNSASFSNPAPVAPRNAAQVAGTNALNATAGQFGRSATPDYGLNASPASPYRHHASPAQIEHYLFANGSSGTDGNGSLAGAVCSSASSVASSSASSGYASSAGCTAGSVGGPVSASSQNATPSAAVGTVMIPAALNSMMDRYVSLTNHLVLAHTFFDDAEKRCFELHEDTRSADPLLDRFVTLATQLIPLEAHPLVLADYVRIALDFVTAVYGWPSACGIASAPTMT